MMNLLNLIPSQKQNIYYRGDEDILEDYPDFLEKLLKYIVNEKDLEMKKKYSKLLQKLLDKTYYNF